MSHTHIVGAGLMGSSIGLGLRAEGWDVTIADRDAGAQRLAHSMGAGGERGDRTPSLVIVAVPPSVAPDEVMRALRTWPQAIVTDVSSVKHAVAHAVHQANLSDRYVGSHPMAGREVSGGSAAQGDLFKARPWVICPNGATPTAVDAVAAVAGALQADIVTMSAQDHDAAVARVSHAPQVVASAVAAALGGLSNDDVALAGQGLRDVTRIAASSSAMWSDIARMNEQPLKASLDSIIEDLLMVRNAADVGTAVADVINRGNSEVARIPGKHGGKQREWRAITVIVPDTAGQLLALLSDVASRGVNIEDLTIEHSPRQPVGLTTLWVDPTVSDALASDLAARGWDIAAS